MGAFDPLYEKIPVSAQHMAVSLFGLYWRQLRFGGGFSQFVTQYQIREHWTKTDWQPWQNEQLCSLLNACVEHVPYYRDNWRDMEKQAAREGSLSELPLLEKDSIRAHPQAFLREDMHPRKPQVFLTSGSTGTPISSYYTIPELSQS